MAVPTKGGCRNPVFANLAWHHCLSSWRYFCSLSISRKVVLQYLDLLKLVHLRPYPASTSTDIQLWPWKRAVHIQLEGFLVYITSHAEKTLTPKHDLFDWMPNWMAWEKLNDVIPVNRLEYSLWYPIQQNPRSWWLESFMSSRHALLLSD